MKKRPKHLYIPAEFSETNLLRTVLAVAGDHVSIAACACAGWYGMAHLSWGAWNLVTLFLWLLIAFRQRGLEVLVHEGSHYNWTRSKGPNDFLVNILAAFPVFSSVGDFRPPHQNHHQLAKFGTSCDPDAVRNIALSASEIDRSSFVFYGMHLASHFLTYSFGWWRTIGTRPLTLIRGLMWHGMVVMLPLTFVLGSRAAMLGWVIYFLLPFCIVLPIVRFVAELAKHNYQSTLSSSTPTSWLSCTISNIGFIHRWFLHPHGDGYHALHHIRPCIPHHQLERAHNWLVENDPEGYGRLVKVRVRVLEEDHQLGLLENGSLPDDV